ncbi:RNA-directed DNA polymerase from mobile element jockey [Plakobranchus ocellatus]|uniref:RNA-directed DNA polymerase from mobile element jockey n=1 Tax=Plakobranchus ocellatus TaxID=259542 RepID=A0AAV4BF81_9GAST|nr:RNA-directed DNA polymerase from mobile element jockey [Plakobranchus ocellatus]
MPRPKYLDNALTLLKIKTGTGTRQNISPNAYASETSSKVKRSCRSTSTVPVGKQGNCQKCGQKLSSIHKKGKEKTKAESKRSISLTSCLCKMMESIINTRLMWCLEKDNILMDEQAGFRQNRSAKDQVTYIVQKIEDKFQDKKLTGIVWIDMGKGVRQGLDRSKHITHDA